MNSAQRSNSEGVHVTQTGQPIAYTLHSGDPASPRPRITLIHSLAMNRDFWSTVVQPLFVQADILTFDVRGHGKSVFSGTAYTAGDVADDLSDLLDHIGWSACAVAGASMGGCLGLAFADKYPQKTSALCMIDSTAWYGADAPLKWSERADKALKEGMSALADFQKTRWFSDQFRESTPSVVEHAISIFKQNDPTSFKKTCTMMGDFDYRHSLPNLKMPVSILVGEDDYATPIQMSELLHQSIPNSTLEVIKDARHLTPLECPEIVVEALIKLLETKVSL